MTTILVTGGTGSTGLAVLRQLADIPRNFNVAVAVHPQSSMVEECQTLFSKFEKVMTIDAGNPQSLDFRGVDELFIIPPNSGKS